MKRVEPVAVAPRKAIPPGRDKAQSEFVAASMACLIVFLTGARIRFVLDHTARTGMGIPHWLLWSAGISIVFALVVWRLRAATGPAAALGALVCMNVLLAQADGRGWLRTAMPALLTLFLTTFAATRYGRRRKESLGTAEPKRGRRASQIAANLGVAGLCAAGGSAAIFAACIAAMAEATADTISSEMGQVLGGKTLLITTGKTVPAGTDGGVSVAGTLCGVAAAIVIVLVIAAGRAATVSHPAWELLGLAGAAGIAGLIFDSLLGATLERWGWIGNDVVNLASTAFSAVIAYEMVKAL